MCKSILAFKQPDIAKQVQEFELTKTASRIVSRSAQSWIFQTRGDIGDFYNKVSVDQLPQLDQFKGLNLKRPSMMRIDGEYYYLCAYNFTVNTNDIDYSSLGQKLSSKLGVIDCFAYPNFWINPAVLKPILDAYKRGQPSQDNIIVNSSASAQALHTYLNALMMHSCPDDVPLIYRTDIANIAASNQRAAKPLIRKIMNGSSLTDTIERTNQGIKMAIYLDPDFKKTLHKAEQQAGNLLKPSGSQHVVGSNGKPISLTMAARLLLERTVRTAIAGSYEKVNTPMVATVGQFAGGASLAAFQPPMIQTQLNPIPVEKFVDGNSSGGLKGRLFSLKLYQLFAEVIELIPNVDPASILFFLSSYRVGKYGQDKNQRLKQVLGEQYVNLREKRSLIDNIALSAGLPTLAGGSKLVQGLEEGHVDVVAAKQEAEKKRKSDAISSDMQKLVEERRAAEQKLLNNPPDENTRKLAKKRLDALKEGEEKLFRSGLLDGPPAYGFSKWQQTLASWKDPKYNYFQRTCHSEGGKSYCMWEPANRQAAADKEAEKKAQAENKLLTPNKPLAPLKLPGAMSQSQTYGAAAAQSQAAQIAAASEDQRRKLVAEQQRLVKAKHEEIKQTQPDTVMDGNMGTRGTGAVRVFTARDAAGNEVFTVLPHNAIANLMILIYAALIIYAGSLGATAYQTLYAVQDDDVTNKLQAVYPARGAATFFFGFGFGTIVAFLASIVEFFNYWRFRYIFGLVLMALPIIVLGSVGISSLNSENSVLSGLLNADPSDVAVTTTSTGEEPPTFWSSILGTDYTDAVTEARESLAISDMLFIGLGIGVLAAGIMIGIPGGPFHTDRTEKILHELRDGARGEYAQRSQIKTHWIIYPILLTVAVIGAGASTIGVATQGGPQIKRTQASITDDDENGDYTSIQNNVAWPQIQGAIVAMVVAVLVLGGLVLLGYVRQQHSLDVAAGRQVAGKISAHVKQLTSQTTPSTSYNRGFGR